MTETERARVAILYNTSWYVFLMRRNLISSLLERGFSVTVISPVDAYTERVKALGVRHIPITMSGRGTNPLAELQTLVQIFRALRASKARHLLSFTVKCNLYGGICAKILGIPQIANISGLGEAFDRPGFVNSAVRALYRFALSSAQRVFFQNQEDAALCVKGSLVPPNVVRVIPGSGVDLSKFKPRERPMRVERRFLMLGRLLPKKGFTEFLAVAKQLRQRHGERVAFFLAGSPDRERPESMEILRAIESAQAEGLVSYAGHIDDVLPLLDDADVVVLPSTYNEGIPRSLLEAIGCGKPIVTTDWKGCRETVVDGENGYLVPPQDFDTLCERIERLALCPAEAISRMGAASRALAERRFDERVVIDSYLAELGIDNTIVSPVRDVADAA